MGFFMKIAILFWLLWHFFHRLIMGKIEKIAFIAKLLQIFGQKFYRNVSEVVFYQRIYLG